MTVNRKKVLVIRLSSLGDVVLSTAALAPLREAGYEIHFLTKAAFAPLLLGHPDIRQVYSFDKGKQESAATEKLREWFEQNAFDLVVDLQNSWRTWKWGRWMGKKARVHSMPKERLREIGILFFRLGGLLSFGRGGRAKKVRAFVSQIVGEETKAAPLTELYFSEDSSLKLPEGEFAALVPVSAWEGKQWPYYEELARLLAKKMPVVVLGGEKDILCDRVAEAAGGISLRGKTTLAQSAHVIRRARWVIGNDTGMLHVAEALGKDVAMVEGPTHEYLGFSPHRKGSLLLGLPLFCRPCSKSGKICLRGGSRKCLRELSVEMVAQKLRAWGLPC